MSRLALATGLLMALFPLGVGAQTLSFPANAALQVENVSGQDSYVLPTGPFDGAEVPSLTIEGTVTRRSWRIAAAGVSTLQVIGPLRDQLTAQGFLPMLECDTEGCGGFDFRFGTEVLPPPDMYVDLGDFRFYSAVRLTEAGQEAVSVLVSRSAEAGFVQVIRVTPDGLARPEPVTDEPVLRGADAPVGPASIETPEDIPGQLEALGHAILPDLTFDTGSAQLGEGPYASLEVLAEYLRANSGLKIALVGHTDAQGSLEGNITLSRRREGSVLERLATLYDIPRSQMDAQGMGYLAPVASNLTENGREANRRVEVILTATDTR